MNKKYIGSSLVGAGVFSLVLGNVVFANPLSDVEWAKYEKKLNEANKVEVEESFFRRLLSYFSVFSWWNYYKDCKVKEYTERNIAISREILGIFKDTFNLTALDQCRLHFGSCTNVVYNYKSDHDQIYSLQKEDKLLNALIGLFNNEKILNEYVISNKSGTDQKGLGGVFERLEKLLDDAIKAVEERKFFVRERPISDIPAKWRYLRNHNSFLKYTSNNIAIAKKILDVLKKDFGIGEGTDYYSNKKDAMLSQTIGLNNPILCAEEYLVRSIGTLFGNFRTLLSQGYKAPNEILDGGIDAFQKKVKELKCLMNIAADNADKRQKLCEGSLEAYCSTLSNSWKERIENSFDFTRMDNITNFSELYLQKCFVPIVN